MQLQHLVRIRRAMTSVLAGAAALASTACLHPTGCDADLALFFSPKDTTIGIGQSFRPSVRLATCRDTKVVMDTLRYSVEDTTIVRVDSLSGTMTGRAVGHTTASVTGAIYGLVARIAITVQ
jgi:Big-like domain-containing protein